MENTKSKAKGRAMDTNTGESPGHQSHCNPKLTYSEEEMRGIGLLRALSLRIMMIMIQGIFHEHRHTFANIVSVMPNWQILHEHLTHATINVYSRAYD